MSCQKKKKFNQPTDDQKGFQISTRNFTQAVICMGHHTLAQFSNKQNVHSPNILLYDRPSVPEH